MKNRYLLILCTLGLLLFAACGETPKEGCPETVKNPVDTYLDNRVDAIDMAKKSLKESNKRVEEQNKAMEAFNK